MAFVEYLHRVVAREILSAADARLAMLSILEGEATTSQIAAFLVALRMRGEHWEELLGFAQAMRSMATPIDAAVDGPLIDTCGTGGDGARTFNISTIAAFVVAGAGVNVAKHGNRSLSSQCGSADLLEELGVMMPMPPALAARAIREVGIGFLFAPSIHPAMKHAQPARAELKLRTVFNLLGPLTNPAHAGYQLIGAPSQEAALLMAQALTGLDVKRAFVVHGSDGIDEITTTNSTTVWDVKDGNVSVNEVTPEDFGVARPAASELQGGSLRENVDIALQVLRGAKGPKRDIVVVNAAAALVVAGKSASWSEGMAEAARSVDSGEALRRLKALTSFGR